MENFLLAKFNNGPVVVSPDSAKLVSSCFHAIMQNQHLPELLGVIDDEDNYWYPEDDYRSGYRPYKVKNGILTIPLKGVLLADFPWQMGAYATGYQYVHMAFKRGLADPDVKGIAFFSDSPGGHASENFELCDYIYKNRDVKPIRAFVYSSATSGSYSISSSASEIVMSRSAVIGSIGVISSHTDMSKYLENEGLVVTLITAGEQKADLHPSKPISPGALKRAQARVNKTNDTFVATVARNRNIDEATIRGTEAGIFGPEEAIENGFGDSIALYEDAILTFSNDIQESQKGNRTMSQVKTENTNAEVKVADRFDEGVNSGKAQGFKEANTRMLAIINSEEGKARPKSAMAAIETAMTADEAIAFLAKIPPEDAVTPVDKVVTKQESKAFIKSMDEAGDAKIIAEEESKEKTKENMDSTTDVMKLVVGAGIAGFKTRKTA